MRKHSSAGTFFKTLRTCYWLCLLLLGFFSLCPQTQAQIAEFTQNTGGANVMSLQVTLTNYPGRGGNLPVTLRYSSQGLWRVGFVNTIFATVDGFQIRRSVAEAIYAEHSTAGWSTSLDVPKVEWPQQNDIYWYTGRPYAPGTTPPFTFRVARVLVHLPDGSTHELRKSDAVYSDNGSIDMLGTFYAVDGSRIRYDSTGQNTGTIYLSDGGRYVLSSNRAQYIDRNGNTANYSTANRQWTDSLGRVIGMPLPQNPGSGDYSYQVLGVNNSTATYTLKFRSLSTVLAPDAQGQTPSLKAIAQYYLPNPSSPPSNQGTSNFPQLAQGPTLFAAGYSDPDETANSYTYMVGRGQLGSNSFNPAVLAEIALPNGQSYRFSYNVFGELVKVIYPTGAYERYEYSTVASFGGASVPFTQGSRGMISRWVSPNGTGGSDESQWQYSATIAPKVVTAPDGSRKETYYFIASGAQSDNFGYQDARTGQPYEERVYASPSKGGAMLRRSLIDYAQTSTTLNKPVPPNTFNTGTYTAYRNSRPATIVGIIFDTGGDALAKTLTYQYASNTFEFSTGLDMTTATEFHYKSVDQTTAQSAAIASILPGTIASKAETTYLNDPTYRNRNILGLRTSIVLKGMISGSLQAVARTDFSYDEIAYPLLTYNDLTASSYTDPGTTVRGNVTTTKRYVDPILETYLATHVQYDQCGNIRNTWDARGIETAVEYSSTYKHAYATQVTAAAPDASGEHGSAEAFVTSKTFDLTTGVTLSKTDPNGQVTHFSYEDDEGNDDPLNRLRKETRPDGGWTKYSFGDSAGDLFKVTETQQNATHSVRSYQYFDPSGRLSRSFTSENATSYIATDSIYDQMGRVWKVSNPYRTTTLDGSANLSHTSDWTTTNYDSLGRITKVTYPDGAVEQTVYQGAFTIVTDPSGRQRRQKRDALGRIVRIDEPDSSGSLGSLDVPTQATSYEYDAQGDLVHVTQGAGPAIQHRYFKYDGLGRLTYERHVERAAVFSASDPVTGNSSWSRKLIYDETIDSIAYSGLLTSDYDARNIQTQYRYDNLNRLYQVDYSDGTPTVTNKYDQPNTGYANKGRLTEALTAAIGSIPATSQIYNYDVMGRVVNHEQKVAGQSYSMTYVFNVGGALTSQTYPSGRVVNYSFDDGARLSGVSSGSTTYAADFDYSSSAGLLKSVTLGNEAVESYEYNSRLQVQSIDLTKNDTQIQHYDYKYGVYDPATNTVDETKNNGQIAQIEGFIGSQKQWRQRFAYDRIGRLSSAREARGDNGQQSFLINYEYDVFGNRYQKQAQNTGNPFSQVWVESSQIELASNRFNTGVTYDDAGNITVDSKFRNRKFQYDAKGRQKQSSNLDSSGAVINIFDAMGQRVATQVGGSIVGVLVYDVLGKLLAEYNSTSAPTGRKYFFVDHQGTPRIVTNNSGVVLARHDYLPFGEELGIIGMRSSGQGYGTTDVARHKYAGMEDDNATGLAHTMWRQNDALSGRWTTPDPYAGSIVITDPQTLNRYSYVLNNPVNFVDPLGLKLQDIGVYQTNDPEFARTLQAHSDAEFQRAINAQYATEHNLQVTETTNGNLTQYKVEPAAGSQDRISRQHEVWFTGYFNECGWLVWWYGGMYALPTEQVIRGFIPDPVPAVTVDPASRPDFAGITIGGKLLIDVEISIARSRHGHWYVSFGAGLGFSWPSPISFSAYVGNAYTSVLDGQRVDINDPDAIDNIMEGISANGAFALSPVDHLNGSLNYELRSPFPGGPLIARPTGSGTVAGGGGLILQGGGTVQATKRIF